MKVVLDDKHKGEPKGNPITIESMHDVNVALEMVRMHLIDISPTRESYHAGIILDIMLYLSANEGKVNE